MPSGVFFRSEDYKARLKANRVGRKLSPEHRAAISASLLSTPLRAEANLKISAALKGKPKTAEHSAAVSAAKKGKKFTEAHKLALSLAHKGKPLSEAQMEAVRNRDKAAYAWTEERRAAQSESTKGRCLHGMYGADHPNWKADRNSLASKTKARTTGQVTWALAVRRRDNYKCVLSDCMCKGRLESHHILPYEQYPDFRYDVDNGVTLCYYHHPRKQSEVSRFAPLFKTIVALKG